MFPDAVEAVRPRAWRGALPRRRRNVELLDDPKGELQRATGRRGSQPYAEADSVAVAEGIRRSPAARTGTSASYDRFVALAQRIT